MYKHIHVLVTEEQYDFLRRESKLTGLSMCRLVRRALAFTYQPEERTRMRGWQASIGWWRHPDAAVVGRRAGIR
jgi:hypothetical protein